jgi:hypothetical protein
VRESGQTPWVDELAREDTTRRRRLFKLVSLSAESWAERKLSREAVHKDERSATAHEGGPETRELKC